MPQRHRPPKARHPCRRGDWKYKRFYPTVEAAQQAAEDLAKETGHRNYPYKCHNCGKYHLSEKPGLNSIW